MTLFREKMTKVFPKEIEAGSENDFYRKVRPIKQKTLCEDVHTHILLNEVRVLVK